MDDIQDPASLQRALVMSTLMLKRTTIVATCIIAVQTVINLCLAILVARLV